MRNCSERTARNYRGRWKKLTIHDDSCQEAFLLVGVPVVGLALLVPEAGHPFGAGQVLTHRVLHAGPPAVLPARPRAEVGNKTRVSTKHPECPTFPLPLLFCPLPQTLLRMETQQTSLQHVSSLQLKYHRSSYNLHCRQGIQKQPSAADNLHPWNPCHSTHLFFKHAGKAANATSGLSTCKTYLVLFMNPQRRRKTQILSNSLYFLCKIKQNTNKKTQESTESGIPGLKPRTLRAQALPGISNKQCNPSPLWPVPETVTVGDLIDNSTATFHWIYAKRIYPLMELRKSKPVYAAVILLHDKRGLEKGCSV